MAIIATNKKGDSVEPIEAGSYAARIYQMIHIGTIVGYQGALQNKVRIGFELPTELHVFDKEKGEQPRVISQDFTLSFNEKSTLRRVITACDPKALELDNDGMMDVFDIESLIGKDLLVTVVHKPKKDNSGVFACLENYTPLPKGMTCPPAINEPQVLSYDNWNEALFEKQPDFIKDKITSSSEYQTMKNGGVPVITAEDLDAVPFD